MKFTQTLSMGCMAIATVFYASCTPSKKQTAELAWNEQAIEKE